MSDLMRILVGYDGSESSCHAIEELKRAGLPKRLEALVLCAADVSVYGAEGSDFSVVGPTPRYVKQMTARLDKLKEESIERAQEAADEGAQKIRDAFPLWNVRSDVSSESPAWALVHKAEEWKANLIVVGAGGHSALRRFIGSISQLVIIHAPCSVRVARFNNRKPGPELRLIVGIDGSKGAEKALKAVEGREWPATTRLHLVYSIHHHHRPVRVTHLIPPDFSMSQEDSMERKVVTQLADDFAVTMREKLPFTAAFVKEGDPKKVLLEEAESWNVDCIFIGARGLGAVRRFFLGSVSTAVAARADCSVEVVK